MDVSAVIPLHNSERWIATAIRSLLDQRQEIREIIVVDDSSTDGGPAIARSFGSKIKYMGGRWRNGNSARNCGLAEVSSEWVQFLDADDFLEPEKIHRQVAASNPHVDVVYSPLIIRDESTGQESIQRPTPGADLCEQWIRWELCQTGAALWRTSSLRQIGGWKEGLPCCQDNELTLRALKAGLKFLYEETPGAVYRIWSEETVCRKDPGKVVDQKTALIDEFLAWLSTNNRLAPPLKRTAGRACFEMARTLAKHEIHHASRYFAARRRLGLITMEGPAAPLLYRFLWHLIGFPMTERIAASLR